jgi:hypothetical protein
VDEVTATSHMCRCMELTAWSRVLLEKLIVGYGQLVKNFTAFMKTERLLLCSREPESDESNPLP